MRIRWNDAGLAPAIVQDADTGRVLMLGWMNEEALERTRATARVHFFSRSRKTLWRKGETSGNELLVRSVTPDCDSDALLIRARPTGPTCHTGAVSCFPAETGAGLGSTLAALARVVEERARNRPEGSYTVELLDAGTRRIAQKVGEEGVEVALAAAAGDPGEVVDEAADLLYHLLVLLEDLDIPPDRIGAALSRRSASRASSRVNRLS